MPARAAGVLRLPKSLLAAAKTRPTFFSQLPLAATTAFVVLLLVAIDPHLIGNPLFLSGLVLMALLTAAAAWLPWARLPRGTTLAIPLLDFVAIGCMIHGANQSLAGVSLLTAFPIIWLAWSGLPGPVARTAGFMAPLLIVWAPFIFGLNEPTKAGMIRPLLIPVVIYGLAVAATTVRNRMDAAAEGLYATARESRLQANQLNTILNVAEVGVVVVDADGHDVLMNRRQQANHELAQGTVPDSGRGEAGLLVFGADRKTLAPEARRPVRRAINGEEYSGQVYWLGEEGPRQRAFSTSSRQIVDDGVCAGSVIVFHDVTEVLAAIDVQEDFMASVSHELRTPLTSILGYLDLAMDEVGDERAGAYLAVVQRNADRLLTLVGDLLNSTRGAMSLSVAQGDLGQVLEAAVFAAGPRAQQQGVVVKLDLAPGLTGNFDAVRMGQAVDNLVSNAIKYSPQGGAVLVRGRSEGCQLVVSVQDHGMGMSDDEQTQLFTRFYRAQTARSTFIPGAGLGLSITRSIMDAHNGTITVESQAGQGSTFTLRFPAAGPLAEG